MERMETAIKKLLAKDTLTGDDAGRIMILDLLAAYRNLAETGKGEGVLTDAERINIVNGLTSPDDIQSFNNYRGVHDFLTNAPVIYDSYTKTFEVYYWRLSNLLTNIKHAEEEFSLFCRRPVIMTKEAYACFLASGDDVPEGGIAVLQETPQSNTLHIDESGLLDLCRPQWHKLYMAEFVLSKYADFVTEALNGMKDMLAECLARRKALELIARFLRIPQIKILIPVTGSDKINLLNRLMDDVIRSVSRCKQGIAYEEDIKKKLSSLLELIDIAELEPLPNDVIKARRSLNYSVIKNGNEAFVASLKRKWQK